MRSEASSLIPLQYLGHDEPVKVVVRYKLMGPVRAVRSGRYVGEVSAR